MVKLLRTRTSSTPGKPDVRFRLRITHNDLVAIGPGKVTLLEAIREHGSISAAAKSLDMSYRRAWVLVDETNRSLKSPAVASGHGGQNGGGTVLTETGDELVRLYRAAEAIAAKACAAELKALVKLLAKAAPPA